MSELEGAETPPGRPARRSGTGRRSVLGLLGASLLAIGAGMLVIGSSLRPVEVRVEGRNRPVNAGSTDLRDIRANNSPTLTQNPRQPANLVVSNRVDTPSFSCGLHVSFDQGQTWAPTDIPFPEGEEQPPRCFAADAAFGPDGTLYVAFVTLIGSGNTPNAAWTSSSTDGGRSLSTPVRATGPMAFHLRLVADPSRAGRIYLSWLQASGTGNLSFNALANPVQVARSDDGGATWKEPVRASAASRQRAIAPSPAVGPGGELYVAYLDLGDDALDYAAGHEGKGGDPYPGTWSLVMARSTDAGATWQESDVDRRIVPAERVIVLFPPGPSVAVDPRTGRVFAAFHDARRGDADVWLWRSSDHGATFGPATRVSDARPHDGTAQYLPKVAVAPDSRVDVVYYDRRGDPKNVLNDTSLQSSVDGGRSFSPRARLSDRSFSSRIGFGSERDLPDLGSRLALVSGARRSFAVWTDTRAGTEASNKQDLAMATVSFSEPSAGRRALKPLGLAVAGAGALLMLGWLLVPRRPPA